MSAALTAELVLAALNLLAVGLEKGVIVGKVKEMEDAGMSKADITTELRKMRDDAIAKAQDAIDRA
jgi:hypothetical protein